jgi:hypothetical protein
MTADRVAVIAVYYRAKAGGNRQAMAVKVDRAANALAKLAAHTCAAIQLKKARIRSFYR